MLAHEQVWNAIDSLAARNGLSASGLARRSGLDPTTFNKSKRHAPDGRPRWPSTESIAKILRATNTSITQLFEPAQVSTSHPKEQIAVPLLGEAHAGFEFARSIDDPIMTPRPARIVNFPETRYEPLFALSVVGDSMQPLYRDGDVLFVSSSAGTTPGDRVVVKLKNDELFVKILKSRGDGVASFHAVNPQHPDAAISETDIEWIARIVYATQ